MRLAEVASLEEFILRYLTRNESRLGSMCRILGTNQPGCIDLPVGTGFATAGLDSYNGDTL